MPTTATGTPSAAPVPIAVVIATPQNSMNGTVMNAPPADTRPQTTPIARPIATSAGVPGSVRPADGLRPSRICVAPAYTITAKVSASARCGTQPESAVASSVPITIAGPRRRTSDQSTPPRRWCVRTLALEVNMIDAMPVPRARCTVWSGANCCAANIAASTGTSVMPPPMPSRPARKPTKAPVAK